MAIFTVLLILALVAVVFATVIKATISSNWYKRRYGQFHSQWGEMTGLLFTPVKRKIFADLGERLKEVKGDVLEIGIGSGQNFAEYPQGTSLIAVDFNPHVEKHFRNNLEKAGDSVNLKKFVVASAEDMNCTGKVGVEDNSVVAVVCTKLLCSLTDEQITENRSRSEESFDARKCFYPLWRSLCARLICHAPPPPGEGVLNRCLGREVRLERSNSDLV